MENQKQAKNKISELIESSLESLRGIVDANTMMGSPIVTESGTTIIPISKVSVGFAGGGNDFTGRTGGDGKNNFSGGGGTGVSVRPIGFLVVRPDGNVELLNLDNPTGNDSIGSSIDTILDKAPEVIEKIKSAIASKKKKADDEKAEEADAPAEEPPKDEAK